MSEKSLPDFNSRIKGDNSHGFKNVAAIIDALNNKRVLEVQESLLEFIYELFPNASSVSAISCKKISGLKGDILIWLDKDKKNTKNISVISGSGNSVHQENIYAFNSYLKNELGAPDELIQSYNSFHFADGTCDNTGGVEARVSAREYKNLHPMELKRVQLFLDRHRRVLLERFIKKNYDFPDVDYIFYGNTELPYWAKIEDLIESEMKIKNNTRATLSVGNLSLQTWNRSLMGRTDDRRLALQVKWGSLRSDVRNIYDRKNGQKRNRAIMGLNYEYEFANMLNKDKDHEIWDKIGFKGNNNDKYIVNVSFNQTSKLAGTKVRPKSDCYVARLNSEIDALMTEKNYVLTEELLAEKGIFYEPIPKTGISVKIPNSTSYTIQKLSFSSFKNIFTQLDPLCFAGSMLYTDKKQLQKNELITTTFGTSIAELCNHLGITYSEKSDEKMYPLLKSAAVSQIKRMLQTDSSVFGAICYGDGLFEEPYCSQYVFEKSKLQTKYEYKPKIMVTTGSGRSKGIFTLAFK
jgi:hypothetical protein